MRIPRIMIAAAGSGSGKTTITCALLELLKKSGKNPASFKCGPDYIDPMFHRKVLGVPSKNLDPFFAEEELTRALFLEDVMEKDIAVVEGVMGLYDGLGGISEEASSYHLAKTLSAPIVLVINARGMGRSLIPLIAGFLQYDTEHLIRGVFLNRTSRMFYETIKPEIERELPVSVIGYLPDTKGIVMESRHLGLKLPGEMTELHTQIEATAEMLGKSLDLDALLRIAEEAGECEVHNGLPESEYRTEKVAIAVAMDEAFCFYYEDNLRLLKRMGAELIPFSPLHDKELPYEAKGLLLGGGYPELYAEQLSSNETMLASIRKALEDGMPSAAECGGFMYLHKTMENTEGKEFPMVGAIDAHCRYAGKLVRFGYVELTENGKAAGFSESDGQHMCWLGGGTAKAHEFHYFDSSDNGSSVKAVKPVSGRSWECVHVSEDHWWGFPHLYYYSNPHYAGYFVEKAAQYKKKASEWREE